MSLAERFESLSWYVVAATSPGRVQKATIEVEALGFETFLPVRMTPARRGRKGVRRPLVAVPAFMDYFFLATEPGRDVPWTQVEAIREVSGAVRWVREARDKDGRILRCWLEPARLRLTRGERRDLFRFVPDAPPPPPDFEVGAQVEIVGPPEAVGDLAGGFTGRTARVIAVDFAADQAIVLLHMFSADLPMPVKASWLRNADRKAAATVVPGSAP